MELLKHFHELTLHPANAKKLKALILQLAVQGKLTAEWRKAHPDVEPAEKLLERVKEEKARLVKEKKIKKEKALPKIEVIEKWTELPVGWEFVRLGEVGDWGAGATPLRSNSAFYGDDINWYKSGELNDAVIDYESEEKITELAVKKTSVRLNKPGDVLIAMYGATIGKTALLNTFGTTNQAVCACTCFSCIANFYLHLLLKALKQDFLNQGEGGAQPNISRIKIRNKVIGLPPLEEQKAIVEIVDRLFKEVEQLEQLTESRIRLKEQFAVSALRDLTTNNTPQEWEALQPRFHTFFNETANIKKLRETILQLAVQGKLTARWRKANSPFEGGSGNPDDHDAALLLQKIKAEKVRLIAEGKIKKEKPLPEITEDEIPYELPEGWVWCRFQEVFDIRDGTHDSPKHITTEDSYPFITSKDFQNGSINFDKAKRISKEDYLKVIQRSYVEKDDVLFSMIGGNIGNQVVVKEFTEYAIKNVALFKFYSKKLTLPEYLHLFSKHLAYHLQSQAIGGAQPFISLTNLRKIHFPLPPFIEQKAIVSIVNRLMALCDALEQETTQSKAQAEQWMKGVVREVVEKN
jgi:type I restriction enzyme, S subunit